MSLILFSPGDEVRGKGLRYIKPEEADLIFDPFELKFEMSGTKIRRSSMKIASIVGARPNFIKLGSGIQGAKKTGT